MNINSSQGVNMTWYNSPTGMIRREYLLNTLVAIWRTWYGTTRRQVADDFSKGYEAGFEDSLDAIAQATGLVDEFEAEKSVYLTKLKKIKSISNVRTNADTSVIDIY